jgi:hypothetical protein
VGANRNRGYTAPVMRSTDKGNTWSALIEIDRITDGVTVRPTGTLCARGS